MANHSPRILCAEDDPDLLRSRSDVLIQAGYSTQAAFLWEADVLLRSGKQFELVIISCSVLESEIACIVSGAAGKPIWVLEGFAPPEALLAQIHLKLPPESLNPE